MNSNILTGFFLVFSLFGMLSCNDWRDVESETFGDYGLTDPAKPESYYESLRAYKSSKHTVSFGWYGVWGDAGAYTANMLAGIPDSMDIVSLWGGWNNLNDSKKADLKLVQEKKGTKVLICTFTRWVGQNATPPEFDTDEKRNDYWGWDSNDEEKKKEALRKYAQALVDSINTYNYDGLDIDYEPSYYPGELVEDINAMSFLIQELGKQIGPKSANPQKLFIIDGQITTLPSNLWQYFNYLVLQAYATTGIPTAATRNSEGNLDTRLEACISSSDGTLSEEEITNKIIVTENMEPADYGAKGGYLFYDRNMVKQSFPSLVGMAQWEPLNGYMKGGFGGYKFDTDRVNDPAYKWMRTAIQTANPAIK